jgi:cytochrome c553
VRAAPVVAGALVAAAAGMAVLAFTGGSDEEQAAAPAATPAAATSTRAPAASSDGLAVWAAHGCGGCHTFEPANAHGMFGPDLALSLQGTDAQYIRQSIVDPEAVTAPSWDSGGMPPDFAERIPPEDLEQLVAFIQRGVKR